MRAFVVLAAACLAAALPSKAPYPIHKKGHFTKIPTTFEWSSSPQLISPPSGYAGIKDPSIIHYEGTYHVFTSLATEAGYTIAYLNFTNPADAGSAPIYLLENSAIGTGYRAAPQIFYFEPHKLWYLVFQNGNAAYSTNPDICNPAGWSAPTNFYASEPTIIADNIGAGYWVDMWTVCDKVNCYLFSSDDNGHFYRSQTTLADFPNGMNNTVIALEDTENIYNLYEASNVYHVGHDQYLLIIEAIGSDGFRFFRSFTSSSLAGNWTTLAATETDPWASHYNVKFAGTPWTESISHGEAVRTNVDQTMTLSLCDVHYLYQGLAPNATGDYNALPWRLGLLTQLNSTC